MDMSQQGDGPQGDRSGARFPSPLEVSVPRECEGWEELYSYDMVFSEDRREFDEDRFWFQDGLHYAEPYHPFDALYHGFSIAGFNQASARLFELVRGTFPQLSDQTIAKMGGGTLLDMGPLHGPTAYPP